MMSPPIGNTHSGLATRNLLLCEDSTRSYYLDQLSRFVGVSSEILEEYEWIFFKLIGNLND